MSIEWNPLYDTSEYFYFMSLMAMRNDNVYEGCIKDLSYIYSKLKNVIKDVTYSKNKGSVTIMVNSSSVIIYCVAPDCKKPRYTESKGGSVFFVNSGPKSNLKLKEMCIKISIREAHA